MRRAFSNAGALLSQLEALWRPCRAVPFTFTCSGLMGSGAQAAELVALLPQLGSASGRGSPAGRRLACPHEPRRPPFTAQHCHYVLAGHLLHYSLGPAQAAAALLPGDAIRALHEPGRYGGRS